jgi:hypothetical protein
MSIRFVALDTDTVRSLQNGGTDAYGNKPVRLTSDGGAIPCRHCLKPVTKGDDYLALAFSPFRIRQPYAETGPIFLHADECERAGDSAEPATMYDGREFILRGYRDNDWINYDVAEVVPAEKLVETAERMLSRNDVAYVHMRSAEFNCYHCRVERAA